MNARQRGILNCLLVVVALGLTAVIASHAQQVAQVGGNRPTPANSSAQAPSIAAQREQIWNSPNMLRARAWLQDYCSKSAKVTPEEAQHYQTELANMSPTQMKLWLMKFDQEEEMKQQQYSMWHQAHTAAMSRAMAADQQTQKAYTGINKAETQAANEEQQQVNEQTQNEQNMAQDKQLEQSGPYGLYNGYGYGGIHYHFHLYPY